MHEQALVGGFENVSSRLWTAECRGARRLSGVSISSAIRWAAWRRRTGDVRIRWIDGDKRSGRIEAHAPIISAAVEEKPDLTLAELLEVLADKGVDATISTLWRFFPVRRSR